MILDYVHKGSWLCSKKKQKSLSEKSGLYNSNEIKTKTVCVFAGVFERRRSPTIR